MVKWTHNSFVYILEASIFMANLQFRSECILNFIFLSNKLLSPRSIHSLFFSSFFFLPCMKFVAYALFFWVCFFFCFELVFDSIESYFYSFLPSTDDVLLNERHCVFTVDSLVPIVNNIDLILRRKRRKKTNSSLYLHLRYNMIGPNISMTKKKKKKTSQH